MTTKKITAEQLQRFIKKVIKEQMEEQASPAQFPILYMRLKSFLNEADGLLEETMVIYRGDRKSPEVDEKLRELASVCQGIMAELK